MKTDVAEFGAMFIEADAAIHNRFSIGALTSAAQNALQAVSKLPSCWAYDSSVYALFAHTHVRHAPHNSRTVQGTVTLRAAGDIMTINALRITIREAPDLWTIARIERTANGGIRLCSTEIQS